MEKLKDDWYPKMCDNCGKRTIYRSDDCHHCGKPFDGLEIDNSGDDI